MSSQAMQTTESGLMVPPDRTPRPPAPQQQSTDLMGAIAMAATDPRVDTDKMRAMFDMRNEELSRVARESFYRAKARAEAEMEPVAKTGFNEHTKSHYARLEHMLSMLVPVITRHGFAQSSGTKGIDANDNVIVVVTVSHEDGHAETHELPIPIDDKGKDGKTNKTRVHGIKSATSYGVRTLTGMIWSIPLGDVWQDDDGNAAGGSVPQRPVITHAQVNTLRDLLFESGADEAAMRSLVARKWKVDVYALEDIPAEAFAACETWIKQQAVRA